MESDWREILSLSQNELKEIDKDKLCESLAWMESDDIDLNFSDLKTLFRLAQDILKYKSEQVNGLLGKLETVQRKAKSKKKSTYADSPNKNSEETQEIIVHQEGIIKTNKEILEQLYEEIAKLEEHKSKLNNDTNKIDVDSESSRNTLSEINTIAQLEADIHKRNRHIRKLLNDVNLLEEENANAKDKLSILSDKLKESTMLIENLTEQLFTLNKENSQLKDALAKAENEKLNIIDEVEKLRKEIDENDYKSAKYEEDFKAKVYQFKNLLKTHKNEIQRLSDENSDLRESLVQTSKSSTSPKRKSRDSESKVKELQEKLIEASQEILRSANLIEMLKNENTNLRTQFDDDSTKCLSTNNKNESDDGKERIIISNLNKEIKKISIALKSAEEMITIREQEVAELKSTLRRLQTDDGINTIMKDIKDKKSQLQVKDEDIKSLVCDVNNLNQLLDNLQLENETMREKLNIPKNEKVPTDGILKKYNEMEAKLFELTKKLKQNEKILITLEMDSDINKTKIKKLTKIAKDLGWNEQNLDDYNIEINELEDKNGAQNNLLQIEELIEENEGLRNGLTEILNFLKDNSTSTSGILSLECPSLDALLQSLEARRLAGWFSPHMKTIIELRTALGSKDALLTALHDSRKEIFEIMNKLNFQTNKTLELEKQLSESKVSQTKERKEFKDKICSTNDINFSQIGTWIPETDYSKIDFNNKVEIDNIICKGNILFESKLKESFQYFQIKFTQLYDDFTAVAISLTDNKNKWAIQEEHYKAQIESLRNQIHESEDDPSSDTSPGLLNIPQHSSIERKCSYLEQMYTQIRTLNENMKNEYLDCKKEGMLLASEYESKSYNLMLTVLSLTDKLRNTVPSNLFITQNKFFDELRLKYRQIMDNNTNKFLAAADLESRLNRDKLDLLSRLHKENYINSQDIKDPNKRIQLIEQSILQNQLTQICKELEEKTKEVEYLHTKINELQEVQTTLLNKIQVSEENNDLNNLNEEIRLLKEENENIKEKCRHVSSQLNIALLQLRSNEQTHINDAIEINMLRHQILDLQSNGDNKAIIARLSGEILLSQLQASESLQAIDILKNDLNKEKQLRADIEKLLIDHQKVFEISSSKYENKIRILSEEINLLREQYQGCLPSLSVENFINMHEELCRKNYDVNEKLSEIEDLRSSFIRKNNAYEQVLGFYQTKCLGNEDNCTHKLKNMIDETTHSTEIEHYKNKLQTIETSYKRLINRYTILDRKFQMLSQIFKTSKVKNDSKKELISGEPLQLQDVHSEDDSSEGSKTYIVSNSENMQAKNQKTKNGNSPNKSKTSTDGPFKSTYKTQETQTLKACITTNNKEIQTDTDQTVVEFKTQINNIIADKSNTEKLLIDCNMLTQRQSRELTQLKNEICNLDSKIKNLVDSNHEKDKINTSLRVKMENFKKQLEDLREKQLLEINEKKSHESEENDVLINNLKKMDNDKNKILSEYKELLNSEREKFTKTTKDLQAKLFELQTKLDENGYSEYASKDLIIKEASSKYTSKIAELEEKCFKTERELESYTSELKNNEDELDRWKKLASERLSKLEQLSVQLKERHRNEMETYKKENQHWITQLTQTQQEHTELRTRLAEQKALHIKQLTEKESQIEQLNFMINNLKTQILNMQTIFSINDPNFDLSAIVEVDEVSDGISQQDSDKLELKFESTTDLNDSLENIVKVPSTSTMIWQEPVIERLRREKQLVSKQNAMLRRQIKALAARERRARLDAQNLKNQVFRITTNGSKVPSAESAALQNKVASLQAQLNSARREAHSNIALWDKWKRSQQTSERWQVKYEDKCQEVKKLETSLHLAKSAVSRLEKEKRILLTRLGDVRQFSEERQIVEKQEDEKAEKLLCYSESSSAPPVSARALLARITAQQRRIAALEFAEKGNEPLVREYEKSLAEITSLKGQVLKLESTLLESQIRSPVKSVENHEPELTYWKNYCDMLKEENMQLTLKLNSSENVPTTAHQQRINDLEQTVLTLRGLVSKLQAEQKCSTSTTHRRTDGSGRATIEKLRNQLETNRIEISNLKRSIHEKDLLLERSKEMLKIAAEREDELLRENTTLHHRLREITESQGGFLSA